MPSRTPADKQLAGFIAKFTPPIAKLATSAVAKMRRKLPGAVVMVYDNYNALAIGFGPTERASEALFSIAVFPRSVALFFLRGAALEDRDGLLKGRGKQARSIRLEKASDIDEPAVAALMAQAQAKAAKPIPARGGYLLIKSISAKQRPRRPAGHIGSLRRITHRKSGLVTRRGFPVVRVTKDAPPLTPDLVARALDEDS